MINDRTRALNAIRSLPIDRQTRSTLRGQVLAGDIAGAMLGAERLARERAERYDIKIEQCAECGAWINVSRNVEYHRYTCPRCRKRTR